MSAYDRFIAAATTRLDLGHRTRWVVDVLVAWIASHPLGMDGLQQQFEQAGLGARFQSWQRPDAVALPVVASELERALGAHAMNALARRSGLSAGAFRVTACDLLPGLIRLLSSSAGQPLLRRPARRNAPAGTPQRMLGSAPSHAMYGMALRSVLWLLALGAVLAITTGLLWKARTPLWNATTIVPEHAARLRLEQQGSQVQVDGCLPTEADRRRVWNALVAVHGRHNVRGGITLDPRAQAPHWLDRLITRLPQWQGDGLRLAFDDQQLLVDSQRLPEAQRLAMSQQLRQDFPALQISGLWGPGLAALAQLPPGADSAQHVAALNLTTLKFHKGTSTLTADSHETLGAVATTLRNVAPGARVEVAAHTDSHHGTASDNLQLSQQRADAVVQALQERGAPAAMLVARGYGQDQPLADNRSHDGRAQNRRIGYRLLE